MHEEHLSYTSCATYQMAEFALGRHRALSLRLEAGHQRDAARRLDREAELLEKRCRAILCPLVPAARLHA